MDLTKKAKIMFEISPKLIEKNSISELSFPDQPLEHEPETKAYLEDIVSNAPELSLEGGAEFKIIFYGLQELLEVHSQVYDVCDEEVVLNEGVCIPKNRIVDVKFNRLL
jgi:hypothetical protein